MPHIPTIAAILLAGITATTQRAEATERRFEVRHFDAIELAGPDQVRVVPGDDVSVIASGDPRTNAALSIKVRGTVLRIDRRSGIPHDKGTTVTITTPNLLAVSITGSGDIDVGRIIRPDFTATISGSGSLVLSELQVRDARFRVGGSGTITAIGKADTVAIDVGGSGRIDAHKVAARDATIAVRGSGDVAVTASGNAQVDAGGSGSVRVTGSARCSINRRGTGAISCS